MPDHAARGDRRTDSDGRDHRLVRRTTGTGRDRDHTPPREGSGVRNRAPGRGADGLARSAEQVDAAVTGQPGFGRQLEAADDLGPGLEWPGRVGGWESDGEGGEEDVHA